MNPPPPGGDGACGPASADHVRGVTSAIAPKELSRAARAPAGPSDCARDVTGS